MEQFKGFQKRNLWYYQLNATRLILKCKQTTKTAARSRFISFYEFCQNKMKYTTNLRPENRSPLTTWGLTFKLELPKKKSEHVSAIYYWYYIVK